MKKLDFFLTAAVGLLVLVFLYLAFIWSPQEETMGNLVRIMYFHVGTAWVAMIAFFVTFLFGCLYLLRRKQMLDQISAVSAEIGVIYTTLTLVTGVLWAKSIWNAWWTWDPRLTTTLILWFLYVGYLLLRGTVDGYERCARISAIYAIIAFVDVPIIHMSVTWWRSIHPQVIDETGFHMPMSMVGTLMFGLLAFLGVYFVLLFVRYRQEAQRFRIQMVRQSMREQINRLEGGV